MPRYDFKGIKKWGTFGLKRVLALSPFTSWILFGGKLTDLVLEFIVNLLANNGLIVFNVGAIEVTGNWDQHGFDQAMDDAFKAIEIPGGRSKLTPQQIKAIDNEVIKAARDFIVLTHS